MISSASGARNVTHGMKNPPRDLHRHSEAASPVDDRTPFCAVEDCSPASHQPVSEGRTLDRDFDTKSSLSDDRVPSCTVDEPRSVLGQAASDADIQDAGLAATSVPMPCVPAVARTELSLSDDSVARIPGTDLADLSKLLPVDDSGTRYTDLGGRPARVSGLEAFASLVEDLPSSTSLLDLSSSEALKSPVCELYSRTCLALSQVETELRNSQSWAMYESAARRCLREITVLLDHYPTVNDHAKLLAMNLLTGLCDTTSLMTVAHSKDRASHLALAEDIFRHMLRLSSFWDFDAGSWVGFHSQVDLREPFIPAFFLAVDWLGKRQASVTLDGLTFTFNVWFHRPAYLLQNHAEKCPLYDTLEMFINFNPIHFPTSTVYFDIFTGNGFDADIIARKICDDLGDDFFIDDRLSRTLHGFQYFFYTSQMRSRSFTAGVCASITEAFRRQQTSGSEKYQAAVWNAAAYLLGRMLIGSEEAAMAEKTGSTDVEGFLSSGIFEFIAHGITHLATDNAAAVVCNVFAFHFKMLIIDAQPTRRRERGSHAKSLCTSRFCQELQKIWLPGLDNLIRVSDDQTLGYAPLLRVWRDLGVAAGFNEKEERVRFKKFGGSTLPTRCAWEQCEYYTDRKPNVRLLACKGCGEVVYCSRQCQVSHWKDGGHKQVCRRVKDH
ncbi:hypothetical protein PENSPDRAFT_645594 [Peniophora sp. CONT]|nr:hypothetical protein PENSPDRAFT_645594 [Peniophora sp. CONT]